MNSVKPIRMSASALDDINHTLTFFHQPDSVLEVCLINPQSKKHQNRDEKQP